MLRRVLKAIYRRIPFAIKYYIKDLYLFTTASLKGGVSLKKVPYKRDFDRVAVLGNGPSMKVDKSCIEKLIGSYDFICVNNFCDDDLYLQLKPKIYVFLDAYFFSGNAHKDWIERRDKTFLTLSEKTSWPMTVIVPQEADLNILKGGINNKFVEIIRFSTQSLFVSKYNNTVGKLYDSGIYGPPQINVLLYGIFAALMAKYKEVRIYGADMSFHNDVEVDQSSSELFIRFRHFNQDDEFELLRKNPEKVEPWRMAELLELSAHTFYAHETLNEYARSRGVSITNASSFSLIDAYPRLTKSE